MSKRLHCMWCGKSVSTPVPDGTIVRATIECPECIEAGRGTGSTELPMADKKNIKPGLYLFPTGECDNLWDWAKVEADREWAGGRRVEFIDPQCAVKMQTERGSYEDHVQRLRHRAVDAFPYPLYGPVPIPNL